MTTVCLCGSFRHYTAMQEMRQSLESAGVSCDWPPPGPPADPRAMLPDETHAAMQAHLARMERADRILIFNPDGYIGGSVAMEIGYAQALGKPVYALRPIRDSSLAGFVTRVVTADEFLREVRTGGL